MSVIYITDHNEVIYDVIKTRKKVVEKSPRYKSYLDDEFLQEERKKKKAFGTMGPPTYPPPNPTEFLRKQPKKVHKGKAEPFKRCCLKGNKHEPLPSKKERQERKEKEDKMKQEKKNFVKENVITIRKLKPREHSPKMVDTRYGTAKKIENSGLEPVYIHSKNFGKPPFYVVDRVKKTKQMVQMGKDRDDIDTLPKCRYITRQERQNLLEGLKLNWEKMQKEFQLLPIVTDTIPKILKKSKMEKDLKELEKDIVLVEKHPYIYVLDED